MKKALLLSMPFGALERQALGLSLFKARLVSEGVGCDLRYLTFTFADLIGVEEYCWISTDVPHTAFAGEWVFTPSLYGSNPYTQTGYVRDVLQGVWYLDGHSVQRILRAQALAPYFIDHCLQSIPWHDYGLVGFTSTFEQNIASLALARRLKAEHPALQIVFGGANWEGEMGLELHRRFPFVDYAFSGEADESFPKFVELVLSGNLTTRKCATLPGLIRRRSNGQSIANRAAGRVNDLDNLPVPDYGDYFRDFDRSSANAVVVPTLLFEGSRGCWWGAKRHCMFCGLNGATMRFRAKSPERALREIRHLVERWRIDLIQAVDNVVPMQYFRSVFPALAESERAIRLFYEIRANLERDQIEVLRNAGVLHVQPGIESFSNHLLELMHKGTRALQNIQVLKWCKECGVQADYNLLYGFPGETEEDYREMLRLLGSVRFLNPPTACGPARLDRFSPYYKAAQANGFEKVRPMRPYEYLYPFSGESVRKIAYYFDYDLAPDVGARDGWSKLVEAVEDWKAHPEPGTLQAFDRPDGSLALLDTRCYSQRRSIVLQGIDREVYDYCDQIRSLASVCDHIAESFPAASLNEEAVRSFLEALVSCGYMLADDSGYLSLALRSESPGTVVQG